MIKYVTKVLSSPSFAPLHELEIVRPKYDMTRRFLSSTGVNNSSNRSLGRFDPNRRLLSPRVKSASTRTNNTESITSASSFFTPPCRRSEDALRKKRRLKRKRQLQKYESQIREAQTEQWLKSKSQFPSNRWTIEQRRALKGWFEQIDRDNSGEIDVDELADPLMSSGLAKSMSEVTKVFERLDSDNSNGIGFEEFLKVMKSDKHKDDFSHLRGVDDVKERKFTKKRNCGQQEDEKLMTATNPIVQLAQKQNGNGHLLDVDCILSQERRKLLLDATMLSAERRDQAQEQIRQWRAEIKKLEGSSTINKRMHDISTLIENMESDRVEKENFVITMKGVLTRIRSGQDESGEEVDRGVNIQVKKFQQSLMKSRNASLIRSRKFMRGNGRRTMIFARKSSLILD